jgi:hypothetical protein
MNKNLVHTLASERKRIKPSHEITSIKGTLVQMYNKRMNHTFVLTSIWMLVHLSSGIEWNPRCMIPRYLCPY